MQCKRDNSITMFLLVLIIYLSQLINAHESEGMDCYAGLQGGSGTCKILYECHDPRVTERPRCGFEGLVPIVCCPDKLPTVGTTTPPQRPNFTPRPPNFRPRPPNQAGMRNNILGNRLGAATPNSISQRKCQEYAKNVTREVSAIVLTADASVVTQTVAQCDYTNVHLIVGGEEAKVGEFPHMVALGYGEAPDYQFNCGGTLVSENWVLSAAHCTRTAEYGDPKIARLGEHNLQSQQDGANPIDVPVAQVILHPEYRPPRKYHDIALIRLSYKVPLNSHIRPACLPQDSPKGNSKAVATGWGRILYSEEASPVLLKVVIPLVPEDTCTQLWASSVKTSTSQLPRGIDHQVMICAGALEGGKDTCLGDSGGPLTVTTSNNECLHTVVGVTSFGKYCGFRNSPGIYTRVSHYVPWIESIVWPNNE